MNETHIKTSLIRPCSSHAKINLQSNMKLLLSLVSCHTAMSLQKKQNMIFSLSLTLCLSLSLSFSIFQMYYFGQQNGCGHMNLPNIPAVDIYSSIYLTAGLER